MKVVSWSKEEWKKNLGERLKQAKAAREPFEDQWELNSAIVYNEGSSYNNQLGTGFDSYLELDAEEPDEGDSETGSNYVFKYIRFLHSQMSTNPPSAVSRPHSSESRDKHSADAGDRMIRDGFRKMFMQENFDQASLKTLVRGTGWIKEYFDVNGGKMLEFNEETNEILMEGKIELYSPATKDMWVDHTARVWKDCRYTFEAVTVPYEEAVAMFPGHAKQLKKESKSSKGGWDDEDEAREGTSVFYVYYEKALPINGMAGRYAVHLEDGTLLETPKKNPHPGAKLPYHIFTDIDVEDQIYGKSNVEYVARNQIMLNRFDSAAVDAMQAHGVCRLVAHEDLEFSEDSITNSNFDVLPYSGNGQHTPHFMPPAQLPPDLHRVREGMKLDIQEIMGVNDSMMGVQKREQSGFSQQTAIEAGNMSRRRLFNKYAAFVEGIYNHYLELVKHHWTTKQMVSVVGKEKSFEVNYFTGADLDGGFDLVVEYGASLPIEPSMRRESIMLLYPMLKEAGFSPRAVVNFMKLNDLEGVYDVNSMAQDRQKEIFDKMIDTKGENSEDIYIAPKPLENHAAMLEFCDGYVMSKEYDNLEADKKMLIDRHINERMEHNTKTGGSGVAGAPSPAAPPPMPGGGGMPPVVPGG